MRSAFFYFRTHRWLNINLNFWFECLWKYPLHYPIMTEKMMTRCTFLHTYGWSAWSHPFCAVFADAFFMVKSAKNPWKRGLHQRRVNRFDTAIPQPAPALTADVLSASGNWQSPVPWLSPWEKIPQSNNSSSVARWWRNQEIKHAMRTQTLRYAWTVGN